MPGHQRNPAVERVFVFARVLSLIVGESFDFLMVVHVATQESGVAITDAVLGASRGS
jgi:hypothetical protein